METKTKMSPIAGWRAYARLHEAQTDPRRKAMAANMMDHYKWEVLGRSDLVLKGVAPDAHYQIYADKAIYLTGHDEIRTFYQSLLDSGSNVFDMDVKYLSVDDESVSGFGIWTTVYPGSDLMSEGGIVHSDDVDDPDGRYLVSQPQMWVLPFNHDAVPLLLGEIAFQHPEPISIRKLEPGEEVFSPVTEEMFTL
jgi:hypothetical protein